jgi:hypothetical protein
MVDEREQQCVANGRCYLVPNFSHPCGVFVYFCFVLATEVQEPLPLGNFFTPLFGIVHRIA